MPWLNMMCKRENEQQKTEIFIFVQDKAEISGFCTRGIAVKQSHLMVLEYQRFYKN